MLVIIDINYSSPVYTIFEVLVKFLDKDETSK